MTRRSGNAAHAILIAVVAAGAAAIAIVAATPPRAAVPGDSRKDLLPTSVPDGTATEPEPPPDLPALPRPPAPVRAPARTSDPGKSLAKDRVPSPKPGGEADDRERRAKVAEDLVAHLRDRVPASTLEWIRDQIAPAEGLDEEIARAALASLPSNDPLVQSFLLSEVANRVEAPEVLRYEVAQRVAREASTETLPALSTLLDETRDRGLRWGLVQGLLANRSAEARAIVERIAASHPDPTLRRFAAERSERATSRPEASPR